MSFTCSWRRNVQPDPDESKERFTGEAGDWSIERGADDEKPPEDDKQ